MTVCFAFIHLGKSSVASQESEVTPGGYETATRCTADTTQSSYGSYGSISINIGSKWKNIYHVRSQILTVVTWRFHLLLFEEQKKTEACLWKYFSCLPLLLTFPPMHQPSH